MPGASRAGRRVDELKGRPGELLGGLTPRTFLRRYWQKRPCLVRGAVAVFRSRIRRSELYELAARDDVESRLVLERDGEYPWQVMQGPFWRGDFRRLPASAWTLLVQNVDLHLPHAADLLRRFSFIPNWRVDDLMVSYAPDNGGVGPHFDSYDVFLLQASGKRRWRVSSRGYTDADLVPGLDLRIIGDFRPDQEWILEPGDMLYLPPGVAHHGIAVGDSLTYSIGFRAPARSELAAFYDESAATGPDLLFRDPDLPLQRDPGRISAAALAAMRRMIRDLGADADAMDRWFGRHVTMLPGDVAPQPPEETLDVDAFLSLFRRRETLQRAPACRSAWIRGRDGTPVLFVNGDEFPLPLSAMDAVVALTGDGTLEYATLKSALAARRTVEALCSLYNAGVLIARGHD